METITCGHCGAQVLYDEGMGYGICEYCGSVIKADEGELPRLSYLDQEIRSILVAKPYAWEYKLLFAVLDSGLEKKRNLKSEVFKPFQTSVSVGDEETIESIEWIKQKLEKLPEYIEPLHQIFSVDLPEAMGPPGLPGNDKSLIVTADAIVSVYTGLLYWGLEFQTHVLPGNLHPLALAAKNMAKSVLEDVERFCYDGRSNFANLQPGMKVPEETNLLLREVDMTVFMKELNQVSFSKPFRN